MASPWDLSREVSGNLWDALRQWRQNRIDINKAGTFLTNPNIADTGYFEDWLFNDKQLGGRRDRIIDIINKHEGKNVFVKTGKKGGTTPLSEAEIADKIKRYVDPNDNNTSPTIKRKILNDKQFKSVLADFNRDVATQSLYDNSRRIPGSSMRTNSALMQQRLGMLKGLGKLSHAIQLPMFAYDLYNADDKQSAFENFIGWTSPRERERNRWTWEGVSPEDRERFLQRYSDEKDIDLTPYATNAIAGAGIGALGGWATGAGIGTGAVTGALAGVAPMAALAAGYGLGSYIDKETGASSKISKLAWDILHGDDNAEADLKAATNPEVVKARQQIALKKELMQKYGLNAVKANNITNRIASGIPINQALQEGMVTTTTPESTAKPAATVTAQPVARNNPVSSGVTFLNSATTAPQTLNYLLDNSSLPNSKLRVYDNSGNFLHYI